MNHKKLSYKNTCWILLLLAVCCADLAAAPPVAELELHAAIKPAPRTDAMWVQRHASFNRRAKQGNVDLLLIGDSITHGWEGIATHPEAPVADIWNKHFGRRKAMNLGISGDGTQHVLWRLDHGNLDGIDPKVAVLMIGTNNSNGNDYTAEQIGEGIQAIVKQLRDKLPQTKVLILAIFPRNEKPNAQREKNAEASQIAARLADGKMIHYLDIGSAFLQDDGTLSRDVMPDFLHLSVLGYQLWATALEDKLAELMRDKDEPG